MLYCILINCCFGLSPNAESWLALWCRLRPILPLDVLFSPLILVTLICNNTTSVPTSPSNVLRATARVYAERDWRDEGDWAAQECDGQECDGESQKVCRRVRGADVSADKFWGDSAVKSSERAIERCAANSINILRNYLLHQIPTDVIS